MPYVERTNAQQHINTRLNMALQRALQEYLGTGQPTAPGGPGLPWPSWAGEAQAFPQGTTLEEMGYYGPVVPEAGPLLTSAFNAAGQLGQTPTSELRQTGLAALASGQMFGFDPQLREQYYTEQFVTPAMRQWREEIIPDIYSRRMAGGQTGALRSELAKSGQELVQGLAGIRGGLLREDEALAQQLTAQTMPGALEGLMQEELKPISVMTQLGDIQRSIGGQQNLEQLYRMMLAQPWGDPRLGLLPLVGGAAPGSVPAGGMALGGLAQLGSGAARLFGTEGLF